MAYYEVNIKIFDRYITETDWVYDFISCIIFIFRSAKNIVFMIINFQRFLIFYSSTYNSYVLMKCFSHKILWQRM